MAPDQFPEHHTIAIAYKTDEWVMLDYEVIDLSDVALWFPG